MCTRGSLYGQRPMIESKESTHRCSEARTSGHDCVLRVIESRPGCTAASRAYNLCLYRFQRIISPRTTCVSLNIKTLYMIYSTRCFVQGQSHHTFIHSAGLATLPPSYISLPAAVNSAPHVAPDTVHSSASSSVSSLLWQASLWSNTPNLQPYTFKRHIPAPARAGT
jgi:hypothetical protein